MDMMVWFEEWLGLSKKKVILWLILIPLIVIPVSLCFNLSLGNVVGLTGMVTLTLLFAIGIVSSQDNGEICVG